MTWQDILNAALAQTGRAKRMDVERLIGKVRNMSRGHLLAHLFDLADAGEAAQFHDLLERYLAHEPLQYILGEAPFFDFMLKVTPAVLIPRYDTETLVMAALEAMPEMEAPKILDLCTGSGAVALALAKMKPEADVYASDLFDAALEVATCNAERLGAALTLRSGDLFAPWHGLRFNCITANPPYITSEEMAALPPEVRREPESALWGGEDGLFFYRRIVAEGADHLFQGGWLLMEIGATQGAAVARLMREGGFTDVAVLKDLQGHDRVVKGRVFLED